MISLQQIIGQLPRMSPSERQKLKQALEFLGTKTKPQTLKSTEDWLLPGIQYELQRRGIGMVLTPKVLSRMAPRYAEDAKLICEVLEKNLRRPGVEVRHAHLLAFGRVVARAIADDLPKGVPAAPKTILQNVSNGVTALEASFPDYLATGMLHRILGIKVKESAR